MAGEQAVTSLSCPLGAVLCPGRCGGLGGELRARSALLLSLGLQDSR